MSRYDWSKAPEWAMWAATSEGGFGFWFRNKPRRSGQAWAESPRGSQWAMIKGHSIEHCPNWRESLEARPREAPNA